MTSQLARTGNRERRLTREVTWLAVAGKILRSRRFHDQVIVGAIVLAALAGLGRDMQARGLARARALSKRLDQRAKRAVEARKR